MAVAYYFRGNIRSSSASLFHEGHSSLRVDFMDESEIADFNVPDHFPLDFFTEEIF